MRDVKAVILQNEGLSSVSWEVAHGEWDAEYIKDTLAATRRLDSGRGPGSPYTQDYDLELELALNFGAETVCLWHDEMHKANWANFVGQIHSLWKRWGTIAIYEVSQACGEKIRWFTNFAAEEKWVPDGNGGYKIALTIPETWDHKRALREWKRSNWVHAITKISSTELAKIDEVYGQRAVDESMRANNELICSLPESHRGLGLHLLLAKEQVEWLKDPFWENNASDVIDWAQKIGLAASEFATQAKEVIIASDFHWQRIAPLLRGNIRWQKIRELALENARVFKSFHNYSKDDFQVVAVKTLLLGDSIDWMDFGLKRDEPEWIYSQAEKLGVLPSQAAEKIEVLKNKVELTFDQIKDVLVPQLGWENAIHWPLEYAAEFRNIPEKNLPWAIVMHRFGDSIEWTKRASYDELMTAREWGEKEKRLASIVFSEIEVFKKAGLNLRQINGNIKERHWNAYYIDSRFETMGVMFHQLNKSGWNGALAVAGKFAEQISLAVEGVRPICLGLLCQNEARNTNWWPQAIDTEEFIAGLTAEKMGREGLAGIQRRRWLKDNLGLDWTHVVDEKINWEKSSEIIKNNPWLKTSLSFVNKEEVILKIAAGQDVSWLKYAASEEEFNRAKIMAGRPTLAQYWQAIKALWSEEDREYFKKLAGVIGEQTAWDYIGNRPRHEQLYFVDAVLKKLPPETHALGQILFQVRAEYNRFAQTINAFEPDGTRFQSFKEFVKYTDLQKGQVVFPEGSPAILREKVAAMMEAPGLSVSAVREFIRKRENWPLITGAEDRNAVFPALRLEFPFEPLTLIIRRALGKRGSEKPEDHAQAESPDLLFKRLCKLAKEAGLKSAADLLKDVPEQIDQEVLSLLREHKVPIGKTYIAEVAPKSNPYGWTCGDWTNCCMQFGSSKNDEYMRRRDMSYFLISQSDRPIAQSVVVAAALSSRNGTTPQLTQAHLTDLDGIALDNVEVAPNYKTENSIIERLYREFWRRYVQRFGIAERVDVFVGKSHNDAVPASGTAPMVWKPLEKMVYSDCFGNSEAYHLIRKQEPKKQKKEEGHELSGNA